MASSPLPSSSLEPPQAPSQETNAADQAEVPPPPASPTPSTGSNREALGQCVASTNVPEVASTSPTLAPVKDPESASQPPSSALSPTAASAPEREGLTPTTRSLCCSQRSSTSSQRPPAPQSPTAQNAEVYQLKPIVWKDPGTQADVHLKIITQNENGPCPLIALCNVLLLRQTIEIVPAHRTTVSYADLVQILADALLQSEDSLTPGKYNDDTSAQDQGDLIDLTDASDNSSKPVDATNTTTDASAGTGAVATNAALDHAQEPATDLFSKAAAPPDRLSSIFSLLPNLEHGLDINVRFHSIHAFEATPELSLFVSFQVPLVHGWLPDPHSEFDLWECLASRHADYNQAVECVVRKNELLDTASPHPMPIDADAAGTTESAPPPTVDAGSDAVVDAAARQLHTMTIGQESTTGHGCASLDQTVRDGLLIEQFLDQTATQLTYHGLITLSTELPDHHLCVLFRNNHFSTLYKRTQGELYVLVTDTGYAQNRQVVWESLQDIDQESATFFDSWFRPPSRSSRQVSRPHSTVAHNTPGNTALPPEAEQIDNDYALALLLQEQDRVDREAQQARRQSRQGARHQAQQQSQQSPGPSHRPTQPSTRPRPPAKHPASSPEPKDRCVIF
ncbi:hypothetical protein H4R34_003086 [Dimargaris verticillata]|uniref:MINDY deubiquitinase domain-containing protein n=1 Tax=Dimargaris verticillata TaxID=2761393 RepID=A0A9W8E9D1_9FUNG|nr:hypothetical protein H4R34_003086 [Dimargaris verticillata]